MHVPINVKTPNNISEWQMGFNSAFKGLTSNCLGMNYFRSCNLELQYERLGTIVSHKRKKKWFQYFTSIGVEITIVGDDCCVGWQRGTNVSEEIYVSIFKVE